MNQRVTGEYVTVSTVGGEIVKAFVPKPLPPTPPLDLDADLLNLEDQALVALGRLDAITNLLPDTSLFLYMYVRKEAVLSSQIEGTQSSLSELLMYENESVPGIPTDDIQEISNYVAAISAGLAQTRSGFPLSLRLFREIHEVLLTKGRGSSKAPGEFRTSQNWIGGSRPGNANFVPPPPQEVIRCLGELEKFLQNEPIRTPVLQKAAMAHVQFETIHPFLDGNGRLGRLLVTLLLCSEGILAEPLLYLSLYFKKHRDDYYKHLQKVRTEGDWENWLRFFLAGVKETAEQAVDTARQLVKLFADDRQKLQSSGKSVGSAMRVHHALQQLPVASITSIQKATSLTFPTVNTAMSKLADMGVLEKLPKRGRSQMWVYTRYLDILNQGIDD